MATVVEEPTWGAKAPSPLVVDEPTWGKVAPAPATPPPVEVAPEPTWEPSTMTMGKDWSDIQWARAKRFASSLGENFADVFTETLPTVAAEGVNALGMTAATALFSAPGSLLDPLGKAIAGKTMVMQNEAENEMLAAQRERAATAKSGPQEGLTDDVLNTVSSSLGKMGAHLVLGGGMVLPSLAVMYADTAKEKEVELMGEGMERGKAQVHGTVEGLIEAIPEYFGLKLGAKLVDDVMKAGHPFFKQFARYMLTEWGGEQVSTAGSSINDAIAKESTVDEWLADLKRQMPVSMIAPVATGAAQLGMMKATRATANLVLDNLLKSTEQEEGAEFVPLPKNVLKTREILLGLKGELAKLTDEDLALTQRINALPTLDPDIPADIQYQQDVARAAGGPLETPADLETWKATAFMKMQPGVPISPDSKALGSVQLTRDPQGNAIGKESGVDWLNQGKYEPGTYVGNRISEEEATAEADAALLDARLQGEEPGTFEYETTRLLNRSRRKKAKMMREIMEEVIAEIDAWRKLYLPQNAFVVSFDRKTASTNSLGNHTTVRMPNGQDVNFLSINLNRLLKQSFGTRESKQTGKDALRVPTGRELRAVMDTAMHEFGHGLAAHWEQSLSGREVAILRRAFLDDTLARSERREEGREDSRDRNLSVEEREAGRQRMIGANASVMPPDIASVKGERFKELQGTADEVSQKTFYKYWGNYKEWIAHQFGKSARHRGGKDTAVDAIFRPIRKAMNHFYRKNRDKWAPNSTYELFLQRAVVRNQADTVRDKRLKAELAYTKALRAMKAKPPETVLVDRFGSIMRGGKGGKGKPPGGSWLAPETQRGQPQKLAQFNEWIKNTYGLLRMAEANNQIRGLLTTDRENAMSYVDLQYKQNAIQNSWKERGYTIARGVIKAIPWTKGREWIRKFDSFIFEADNLSSKLERKLTIEEVEGLREKYGLEEKDVATAERVWTFMRDAVTALEEARARQLQDRYAKELIFKDEFETLMKELRRDSEILRNRNYMPHTRFGKYILHGKTMQKNLKMDDYYTAKRIGDTAIFETFQNEKEMQKALVEYQNRWGSKIKFETHVASDAEQMFLGFDPLLSKQIIAGLGMGAEQAKALETLLTKLSPTDGFRKRLIERKGIPGYSTRTVRVFADYSARFGNFLSRMETVDDMREAIEEMKNSNRGIAGPDGVKRSEVVNWVERHMEYMMNPGDELAGLRAAGFLWYIGLMPKSAIVNLTQVPLVTYPYLASQYGDIGAVRELSAAYGRVTNVFKGKGRYTAGEQGMFDTLQYLLDESFASMLGGLQEGSILERMTNGRVLGDERFALMIHQAQYGAGWMFSAAEQYNRRVTALAAYNLSMKKHNDHARAVTEARMALERTQYEYARFNRPEIMRGKKSAFFLFQQYMLNTLQFLGREGGGRGRFFLMMLLIGGLQGMPFGDTVIDMVDWFVTKYKEMLGLKDPKVQLRHDVREFLRGLSEDSPYIPDMSDVVLRGLSANLGPYDVSGSVGFGRPIPGTDSISREGMTPLNKAAAIGADLAGPLVAVPIAGLQAWGSDDPDPWRRWEKVMPSAIAGVSKARRYWANGEETDYYGDTTATFDVTNPWQAMEIAGQAAGFAPSRVTEKRQLEWMAKESIKYYEGRAHVLLTAYEAAVRAKDPEAKTRVKEAIRAYNEVVPHKAFRIPPESIEASITAKLTRSALVEKGMGRDAKYGKYYKEYMGVIGEGTPEAAPTPPGPTIVEEPQW